MPDQRRPEEQHSPFIALWQKPKCKQPQASEATACEVRYVMRKRDGWSKSK